MSVQTQLLGTRVDVGRQVLQGLALVAEGCETEGGD